MKKRLLFGLMVVMAVGVIAKNVTGKVHYIGKGLPGVVVTDGRTFTETNDEGVYSLIESSAKEVRNYFKSLHHPADYQLKIFPFGTFEGHADELCVKVWNWDKTWKVEWMEDGVKKGDMKQFTGTDPDYGLYIEREEAQGKKRTNNRPNQNPFIFFSAKPSDKTKVVKVLVTDRFGKQYSAEYQL